ncbi:MAG: GrpB family protein [Saprospiraceae bacterium]
MLIQKYNKKWVDDFNKIKEILSTVLIGINNDIEHIGSTAVPQLAAKAIIDIDIIFYDYKDFEGVKFKLEELNYYHNGDQGIDGREVFIRKSNIGRHAILDTISHHLYVCFINNEELKRHLLFRNYLRINNEARNAYQKLKIGISKIANEDKKLYADLKETMAKDFIEHIICSQNQK